MSVTVHQRPGVYSSYDASSVVSGGSRGRMVGIAAVNAVGKTGEVHIVTGYEKAVERFGVGELAELVRLVLKNGARGAAVAAVADTADYEAAFTALAEVEDISVVICDSTETAVQQKLKESVAQASAQRMERIAVVGGGANESVDALVVRAEALNSERVVLVAPGAVDGEGEALSGVQVAAAVAGVLAGETDPAIPLGGAELLGLKGLAERYSENDLDRLILGGVTPVENLGGTVSVVRGVTTRTTSGGAEDSTWRDLATIRVVDDVIPTLRQALRAKFRRVKNTQRGRGAIRAQVVLELENKLAKEIITGYENVAVTADPEDPTRCLVDFSFTVAHGLNQIWLTAHITV